MKRRNELLNPKSWSLLYRLLVVCVGAIISLTFISGPVKNSVRVEASPLSLNVPNEDHYIYLPVVFHNFPIVSVFGLQLTSITTGAGLNKVSETETDWIMQAVVPWSAVEPNQGDRNWDSLGSLPQQLINAAQEGLIPIVDIRSTPEWAQLYSGYYCGPMKDIYFGNFANFLHDLVTRYSKPPYNVKYWEIWNEPDIDHSLVNPTSSWGCWGDPNDLYYGGGYYASMLQVVYPAIKQADPGAQVLIGGLLLDCDPVNPPDGKTCLPSKFLEGILENGGGAYFDGVNFHAYEYYYGSLGHFANTNWNSSWDTTGPALIAKATFLKSVLDSKNITGKYLINTECGLICDSCTNDSTFETTKAYYVAQAYSSAIRQGLKGNLWYRLLGWRNSNLLTADLDELPAFVAYKFASMELRAANSTGDIGFSDVNPISGVKGYKFSRDGQVIWVLWSLDGVNHTVTLSPGTPSAIYNVSGGVQVPGNPIEVSLSPIYIEW